MHFMHPVVTVPLVELAKGMHTSLATFESTVALCQRLGKTVCVSQVRVRRMGVKICITSLSLLNNVILSRGRMGV